MDDYISRQEAIDVCNYAIDLWHGQLGEGIVIAVRKKIAELPSVQPEQSSEIQDILNYLDTVLHPIISPEHWNVYSELHDMISMLPSVQPEDCDTCKHGYFGDEQCNSCRVRFTSHYERRNDDDRNG